MEVSIEPSWKKRLAPEFERPYFKGLASFVKEEYANGAVYPGPKDIFRAFDLTPFEEVKVLQSPFI